MAAWPRDRVTAWPLGRLVAWRRLGGGRGVMPGTVRPHVSLSHTRRGSAVSKANKPAGLQSYYRLGGQVLQCRIPAGLTRVDVLSVGALRGVWAVRCDGRGGTPVLRALRGAGGRVPVVR